MKKESLSRFPKIITKENVDEVFVKGYCDLYDHEDKWLIMMSLGIYHKNILFDGKLVF